MYACLYLPPRAVTSPAEPDATKVLVNLARRHSPRVEWHGRQLVMLDVRGLGRLWGSPREIGATLRRTAADRGLVVRVAVASTRMAALLATQGRSGLTVVLPGTEAATLASLPLAVLKQLAKVQANGTSTRRSGRIRKPSRDVVSASPVLLALPALVLVPVVQRWGLKTLGELAALPSGELFERLGPGGLELQRIARGEDERPLVPEPVEERFEQTLALEWPIEGLEPLSFVLGRVLKPLCASLERRELGVATLRITLTLVSRATHERTLQLPAPLRDPRVLRTLILLDLESHPPTDGIDRVTVIADPVPARVLQFSLLERALPPAERLSTLLARLSALMGERRCGAPVLVDTSQPGAFEMKEFAPGAGSWGLGASPAPSSQLLAPVLRRFRKPVAARVTVERGRPVRVATGQRRLGGGRIVACAGPWRSSGQWWLLSSPQPLASSSFGVRPWNHDEWDVALSDGGVYRIFRDRAHDRWFVEGIVD